MWSKIISSRVTLWVMVAVLSLVLIGGAVAYGVICHWLPYRDAANGISPDGVLTFTEQTDGSFHLQWPEGNNADSYTLTVLDPATEEVLFTETTDAECSCLLPKLPNDRELTIQITTAATYGSKQRPGDTMLRRTLILAAPRIGQPQWEVDLKTGRVDISFTLEDGDCACMYLTDENGNAEPIETLTKGNASLTFGDTGAYPIPDFDNPCLVEFDVRREAEGMILQSRICQQVLLYREDFLGTDIALKCEDLGNNAYRLSWSETKGDHYELQQKAGNDWKTLHTVEQNEELFYHTGHLEKFKDFTFRVIAIGGQVETDKPIASQPITVTTGAAAVYSTVWPLVELKIYDDPACTNAIGKAPAGAAYCVLEETEGMFGIRHEDGIGYIDSNYCLINLPEYMEDLCAYDISNSYDSLYMVHDYEINKVTGTVVQGYEHVRLGKNEYLVPYLYPCAQKLLKAATTAQESGYKLLIYDSFRPQWATSSIYNLTGKILKDPIPEYTFAEKRALMEAGKWPPLKLRTVTTAPEETAPEETVAEETVAETTQPEQTVPETTAPEETKPVVTYEAMMTDNGRYALGHFLAPGYSHHNIGIALDLTLMSMSTGKEIKMQTAIHDLSWYSEISKNNKNANILRGFMTGAGFVGLGSEWWHFQDNDAKDSLKLAALPQGVSPQCWMKDDTGWRYRCTDGSYYKNCQKTIDGTTWQFDANGYVVE